MNHNNTWKRRMPNSRIRGISLNRIDDPNRVTSRGTSAISTTTTREISTMRNPYSHPPLIILNLVT